MNGKTSLFSPFFRPLPWPAPRAETRRVAVARRRRRRRSRSGRGPDEVNFEFVRQSNLTSRNETRFRELDFSSRPSSRLDSRSRSWAGLSPLRSGLCTLWVKYWDAPSDHLVTLAWRRRSAVACRRVDARASPSRVAWRWRRGSCVAWGVGYPTASAPSRHRLRDGAACRRRNYRRAGLPWRHSVLPLRIRHLLPLGGCACLSSVHHTLLHLPGLRALGSLGTAPSQ